MEDPVCPTAPATPRDPSRAPWNPPRKSATEISLNSVATASLGVGKTADGQEAIRWWREGRLLEIAESCCFDVKGIKLVHEYGVTNQHYSSTTASSRTGVWSWSGSLSDGQKKLPALNARTLHVRGRSRPQRRPHQTSVRRN